MVTATRTGLGPPTGAASSTAIDLHLRNRMLRSEAGVEALVSEIHPRLLDQIKTGDCVRLT